MHYLLVSASMKWRYNVYFTSSMSINCGTNGHFCSCLIHALGTECLGEIIIPIFDPQLTFKSQLKQLEECELLRQIVKQVLFVSSTVSSSRKMGFTLCLQNSQVFLKLLEQIEVRQRSEEIGTELVNL